MTDFEIIVSFLPIVFMFHDFEEIIFLKPWLRKNTSYLQTKFPGLAAKLLPNISNLSTGAFALAVFEEFILLGIITFTALYFKFYPVWAAAFMAFSIHLIIHIVQWFVVRRYIPAIITSILVLPYCIYGFIKILDAGLFSPAGLILYTLAGIIVAGVNLVAAHKLAHKFDHWKNKLNETTITG